MRIPLPSKAQPVRNPRRRCRAANSPCTSNPGPFARKARDQGQTRLNPRPMAPVIDACPTTRPPARTHAWSAATMTGRRLRGRRRNDDAVPQLRSSSSSRWMSTRGSIYGRRRSHAQASSKSPCHRRQCRQNIGPNARLLARSVAPRHTPTPA
jgi:hypothetical protein